ncbi:MAG: DUF5752 family protein [Candidatus Thermoplasmatota archaeon]|nr:DUF5752 family protein [Candidatus Thermoplasmatota archaeon]
MNNYTAKEPFVFYTRFNLAEFIGRKAKNLNELLEGIKNVSGSVIYYHTYNFLYLHHYLTPQPHSEFAFWVSNVLHDEELGETLSTIDPTNYSTIADLRKDIISKIEKHITKHPEKAQNSVPSGMEFFFRKAVTFIVPTRYSAHNLREFVECLKKISINSLCFHIIESTLRLERGKNDFSNWLENSVEDTVLAEKVARIDIYRYTLEELRELLIKMIGGVQKQ